MLSQLLGKDILVFVFILYQLCSNKKNENYTNIPIIREIRLNKVSSTFNSENIPYSNENEIKPLTYQNDFTPVHGFTGTSGELRQIDSIEDSNQFYENIKDSTLANLLKSNYAENSEFIDNSLERDYNFSVQEVDYGTTTGTAGTSSTGATDDSAVVYPSEDRNVLINNIVDDIYSFFFENNKVIPDGTAAGTAAGTGTGAGTGAGTDIGGCANIGTGTDNLNTCAQILKDITASFGVEVSECIYNKLLEADINCDIEESRANQMQLIFECLLNKFYQDIINIIKEQEDINLDPNINYAEEYGTIRKGNWYGRLRKIFNDQGFEIDLNSDTNVIINNYFENNDITTKFAAVPEICSDIDDKGVDWCRATKNAYLCSNVETGAGTGTGTGTGSAAETSTQSYDSPFTIEDANNIEIDTEDNEETDNNDENQDDEDVGSNSINNILDSIKNYFNSLFENDENGTGVDAGTSVGTATDTETGTGTGAESNIIVRIINVIIDSIKNFFNNLTGNNEDEDAEATQESSQETNQDGGNNLTGVGVIYLNDNSLTENATTLNGTDAVETAAVETGTEAVSTDAVETEAVETGTGTNAEAEGFIKVLLDTIITFFKEMNSHIGNFFVSIIEFIQNLFNSIFDTLTTSF